MLSVASSLELNVRPYLGDLLLLLLVAMLDLRSLGLLLILAFGVASVKEARLAVLYCQSLIGCSVKKITVVGDYHNRLLVRGNKALEPFERIDIKMVCGLVKHKYVRLCRQKLRKGKPCVLTARKRVYLLIYKPLVKPEP